ncbi:erythromycin esterase family protein [Streptomyces sp. SID3343]|uniref:erythromycin esterase family protein n=1 Tax=Streptomyces sp. SID3343 TaxID=2690260 RepID=UPI001368F1E4|nr:erythromycin esterase family protein [Streptomyces sp. SID3343]MYV99392.1 erythromycin esterase family protein [Streptomyces sp. SID3343]
MDAESRTRISRRGLLTAAVVATGTVVAPLPVQAARAAPVDPSGATRNPIRALEEAAHRLCSTEPGTNTADLRALGAMIRDAEVVGLGEATHGSHEFFTMKERVFRYLVEEKGFTTFSLELSWSAGLLIDEYLHSGKGDARTVAKETLAGSPWDREEFVSLIRWMREYNRRHPYRTVHFMGADVGAPTLSDEFFGRVTGYVGRHHPDLLSRVDELYTGLRPIDDVYAYLGRPLAERQRLAAKARQVLELIGGREDSGTDAFAWAEQNARSIADTATFLTIDVTDPDSVTTFERFRDEVMARNVTWWHRHTGHKILVSAHNGHVGYVAGDPKTYPKTQGSFLRDAMGRDYLPIGFTFDRGSFLSKDAALGGDWKTFTVGAAEPGSNEYTLDRVGHRDYYLDLRNAPRAARDWLGVSRPTYDMGTQYPYPLGQIAIGRSYDVLIHLHAVREADRARQ